MKLKIVLYIIAVLFLVVSIVSAHPGNLDGNGGHTCWTNCEKWGLKYGEYHYHTIPIPGDIDGDGVVTVTDALIYLKYSLGNNILPYQISGSDDVTCDGFVNINDALAVLKKAVDENFNFNSFCIVYD